METNEIKVTEEAVVDTTKEITSATPKISWTTFSGVVLLVAAGYGVYKLVKSKTKKEAKIKIFEHNNSDEDYDDCIDDEIDDDEEK